MGRKAKMHMNTSLLCRCSLTNPEPGTTMTIPTWPRKQVLNTTVTPKICISAMWTLLRNVSCVSQHCVFIPRQVKRRSQMQESSILTLNKPVWDMSTVRFKSHLCIFTVQMNLCRLWNFLVFLITKSALLQLLLLTPGSFRGLHMWSESHLSQPGPHRDPHHQRQQQLFHRLHSSLHGPAVNPGWWVK